MYQLEKHFDPDNPACALTIFGTENLHKLLEKITIEVRTESKGLDVKTKKGRVAIASLAHKVSRSKTALDGFGKELVSDWKNRAKLVDTERRDVREQLDSLRDEVRQPLDEFIKEKKRIEALEIQRLEMERDHDLAISDHELFLREEKIRIQEQRLAEEAELRRQEEERERQKILQEQREKQIAIDAAEVERKRAEDAIIEAKLETERVKQEAINRERVLKEHQEKKDAEEKQKIEDEFRAQELEIKRLEDEANAKVQQAIHNANEKIRIAKEHQEEIESRARLKRESEKKEEEVRQANKEHQRKLNRTTLKEMQAFGLSEEQARHIVTKIAQGKFSHLSLIY